MKQRELLSKSGPSDKEKKEQREYARERSLEN